MTKLVFLQDIDIKNSPVVRSAINPEVVADYAELYKTSKTELPPIDVFSTDGKFFLLADGFHRLNALLANQQKTCMANIHEGNYEEALKFALLCNRKHGLRRSNGDKRVCIIKAIKQWPKQPDLQIAKMCQVNNHTVKTVRQEMESKGAVKPEPARKSVDGRTVPSTNARANGNSQSPRKSKELVDAVGTPVPAHAAQYWLRLPEIKEMLDTVSELSKRLAEAQKGKDLMFAEVNFSAAIGDLSRIWSTLKTAYPYAVCTQCQGQPKTQPKGECRLCLGRGVISKFRWDTLVPAEIRKMKEKKS